MRMRDAVIGPSAVASSANGGKPVLPPLRHKPLYVVYGTLENMWGQLALRSFYGIFENLTQMQGWVRYQPPSDNPAEAPDWDTIATDIATKHGAIPDVILFFQDYPVLDPEARPRAGTLLENTVFLDLFDDLHGPSFGHYLPGADILLPTYEYLIESLVEPTVPEVADVIRVWLPHSAMPTFARPMNPEPMNKILLVGRIKGCHYREILSTWVDNGDPRLDRHPNPGYFPGRNNDQQKVMADATQRYIAAITDSARTWLFSKSVELPTTGALMLLDDAIIQPMEQLGFIDGVHYIAYDDDTMNSTLDWVLDPANRPEVDRIRAAGQRVALERHQTYHRVEQILEIADAVTRQGGRRKKSTWWLPHRFQVAAEWGPWDREYASPRIRNNRRVESSVLDDDDATLV